MEDEKANGEQLYTQLLTYLTATKQEALPHATISDLFAQTFTNFHDIKITTRSLHGSKRFTAWEWVLTFKTSITAPDSKKEESKEEGAQPKKVLGCTLMWWNEKDKIVKHHDYTLMEES